MGVRGMLEGNQMRLAGDGPRTVTTRPPLETAESSLGAAHPTVDAHLKGLFAWLVGLCRDRDRAADLTQECFAALWAAPDRDALVNPRAWLYRTARNLFFADIRRRRREAVSSLDDGLPASSGAAPRADVAANAAEVRSAVLSLPRSMREPIVLRYWCGMRDAEIAEVLRVPLFVVRWRIHSGKKWLRTKLESHNPSGGDDHVPR